MPGGLSTVVLVAAATGAALTGIGPALMRGVTLRIDDATSTPDIAAFSHASAAALFFYASIFFAIEALAASAAALRGGTLPRWFGWLAMILGAAMIIGAAGAAFGSALAFIGSMALLSFHIVGSIVVWRAAVRAYPRSSTALAAPTEVRA